ncbi:hypothetical protein NBRGN_037_00470 [Nocardia brasiliensis NBRC 14402]|uniref:hypothetical protein n=1 Tax=Nocardia brasiliensis TaxID=37326 RepID=UPI00045CDA52|nr:hypothetical protein [Nocardia brasiliensis]GAJ81287.1 hypothetical protein NBRGN_037_00470 [Nocardia brasiliensis NBRC 14402]SUB54041.1 Uncharacterised protein [Nocardia brasiliensis]
MSNPPDRRLLLIGWSAYMTGFALHSVAHIYLWHQTPIAVRICGIFADVVGFVVLALIVRRHPWAAVLLAHFGSSVALSLIVIHIPFYWGPFSQPWYLGEIALPYWLSLIAGVAGGLIATAIGISAHLRSRDRTDAELPQ